MLFLIACIPCYASYRLRNYQLLAVTVVCALLSFLVLPFMSAYGISMNGYQFFRLSTFSASVSTQVIFFSVHSHPGLCLKPFTPPAGPVHRGTGSVPAVLWAFAILSFNLIYYRLASYGAYLLIFLYLAGIISLYVSTASMFQTGGAARTSQEDRTSIPKPLGALGTEARSALSDAAGKIGSAVKTSLSERKRTDSVIIHCIRGAYAGADFVLRAGDQLTLGTDPDQANHTASGCFHQRNLLFRRKTPAEKSACRFFPSLHDLLWIGTRGL